MTMPLPLTTAVRLCLASSDESVPDVHRCHLQVEVNAKTAEGGGLSTRQGKSKKWKRKI